MPEVLELPQRPWSELLHSFLGWSEGLMFLLEEPAALREIVDMLEQKIACLVSDIARYSPGTSFFPRTTLTPVRPARLIPGEPRAQLCKNRAGAARRRESASWCMWADPSAVFFPAPARCGVDCVQGISGPPQGDSTLAGGARPGGAGHGAVGRDRAGVAAGLVLGWGLPRRGGGGVHAGCRDPLMMVGVADRIPADALPAKVSTLSRIERRGVHLVFSS